MTDSINITGTGVARKEADSERTSADVDQSRGLIGLELVFPHQDRWTNLSEEDYARILNEPIDSVERALRRFEPEASFELSEEEVEAIIAELEQMGVTAGRELGPWAVRGVITSLQQFAPGSIGSRGGWRENIIAELASLARTYRAAGSFFAKQGKLDATRQELLDALDASIDALGGHQDETSGDAE